MPLKVVYLDDEPMLCEIFADQFTSEKVQITTFSDVNKMLAEVQFILPDLLFLDYRLPGTTGENVAREFDKVVGGKSQALKFLITGDIDCATEFKFEMVIRKPMDVDVIQKILDHEIKLRSI